jgi:hypothetical protein
MRAPKVWAATINPRTWSEGSLKKLTHSSIIWIPEDRVRRDPITFELLLLTIEHRAIVAIDSTGWGEISRTVNTDKSGCEWLTWSKGRVRYKS